MQEVGDEIRIYYFRVSECLYEVARRIFPEWEPPWFPVLYPSYLGLATLPRDRFAYAAGPGALTTNPMDVSGEVWLNVEGNEFKVAALDGSGRTVSKGRLGKERSLTVYRKVDWAGSKTNGETPSSGSRWAMPASCTACGAECRDEAGEADADDTVF